MRQEYYQHLDELRNKIVIMGSKVSEELELALKALDTLDLDLAQQVFDADVEVDEMRSVLQGECFTLIATQQPTAVDLRAIVAVMNMIVDLERMGDQARGIAKVIPFLTKDPNARLPELKILGSMVGDMLHQGITAYANEDVDLARQVVEQDVEADKIYAKISTQIMQQMAETKDPGKVEASYKVLRAARELERFGDLAAHIGERVIFKVTGEFS